MYEENIEVRGLMKLSLYCGSKDFYKIVEVKTTSRLHRISPAKCNKDSC